MSDTGLTALKEVFEQLKDDIDVNQFEEREKLGLQHLERLRSFIEDVYKPFADTANGIEGFPYKLALNETKIPGKGAGFFVLMSRNAENQIDKNIYFLLSEKHADKGAHTYIVENGRGHTLVETTSINEVKKAFVEWFFRGMDGRDKRAFRDAVEAKIESMAVSAAKPGTSGPAPAPTPGA